ncbi:MAG: type II toxin-antitoxin system death-on-curing family toxin [Dinghuibacter sp.]|nr:type II toxin-antitoxin system death-on-curing family toxin [Dinghuibacter sp.]
MILVQEVEAIHQILIDKFGGSYGTRDRAALESALLRPFQTFNQTDLYKTVIEKASALLESMLINHPFVDGNKRTGYTITRIFLLQNGFDISASQTEKYDLVIGVASGEIKYDEILEWFKISAIKKSGS